MSGENANNVVNARLYLERIGAKMIGSDNTLRKVINPVSSRIFILFNESFLFEGYSYDFEHNEEDLLIDSYSALMYHEKHEYEDAYLEEYMRGRSESERKRYYYAKTKANSADEFIELLIAAVKNMGAKVVFGEDEDFLLSDDEFDVECYLDKRGIIPLENNTVTIRIDRSCDMERVEVNGVEIMEGNSHDFHPGCHGMDLPSFNSSSELAKLFDGMFKSSGKESEIVVARNWKYDG